MAIQEETVEYIAHLARLVLSEEEKKRMRSDMGAILAYMDQLNTLDTRDVPATSHVFPPQTPLRDDKARPSVPTAEIMRNAPQTMAGHFAIPKVIESV